MISTMYVILNEPTFVGPIGKMAACIAFFSIIFSMMKKGRNGREIWISIYILYNSNDMCMERLFRG